MVLNMTASLAVAINLLPPGSPLFPDEKIEVCTEDGMFALVKEFPSHFETVQHRLLPLQATPETHRETQPAQRTQRSATLRGAKQKPPSLARDTGREQKTGYKQQSETSELRRSSRTKRTAAPDEPPSDEPGSHHGTASTRCRRHRTGVSSELRGMVDDFRG
ncbi:hypothetical protein GGTG_13452 [Gaeumannomyces tritici R3-111a-1]|uniref:Uncharacterized protein n=1 Tax=Gaeumannomyces tritici (strain R3-111a-1) TaxID=644352 RepID=J3PIX2_GAET3|nr:hypothetical protein GGTG_13452 [Gaeumannomyces tritici R3-111a-1]EJT68946.1 hypothetical protein GGTG_13452 [Gaeumannomyces tritici R3-111a-1]